MNFSVPPCPRPGRALAILLALSSACAPAGAAEALQTVLMVPGTTAEAAAVTAATASTVKGSTRLAEKAGGWTYGATVPPGSRLTLSYRATGTPVIEVTEGSGRRVPIEASAEGDLVTVKASVDASHPLGGQLWFGFRAESGPISVRDFKLVLALPDRAGDGLGDVVEGLMGAGGGARAALVPRPAIPHTAFFFSQPYDPTMAVPTDTVQLYLWDVSLDKSMYPTWAEKGYDVQTFLHSRYGKEMRDVPDEDQMAQGDAPIRVTDAIKDGKDVFQAIVVETDAMKAAVNRHFGGGVTFQFDKYKVPSPERIALAKRYYEDVLRMGVSAFCFDEPEFWAQAGYSKAFRREWEPHYGTPWQEPDLTAEARFKADQLKAFMIRRWVETILSDVQKENPAVRRMMALHSPINYYKLRMATPHDRLFTLPQLQDVVAEVWNDPFEQSYLEYSSFLNLARGRDLRLWFMMDPWGDSPVVSMDFYRHSYGENLLAALMFPQVDTYQPLIWPNRLFGHLPKDYEVIINAVTGALTELWRYPGGSVKAGSPGIGTFVADSMGWQRALPFPSDFEGFYGVSSTFVLHGIPQEVLSLDRADEPGYLDGVKCLLVSYDFLKPMKPSLNRAIADWTRRGGSLVLFGGGDGYNALADSWWRKAGFSSPIQELLSQLGLAAGEPRALSGPPSDVVLSDVTGTFGSALADVTVPFGPSVGLADFGVDSIGALNFTEPKPGPRSYPITLQKAPAGSTPLFALKGGADPVAWEARAGKGSVTFEGVAPGFLYTSKQGSAWGRALVARAMGRTGQTYREQPYFLVRRGPYTGVRALDGAYAAKGRFVDLLSEELSLVEDPVVAAGQCAFWVDAGPADSVPRLLAAAGRVRATFGSADTTSFVVQAPSQTPGVARVWTGGRAPAEVTAFTVLGASVPATFKAQGGSLQVRYDNEADGVIVRVRWK